MTKATKLTNYRSKSSKIMVSGTISLNLDTASSSVLTPVNSDSSKGKRNPRNRKDLGNKEKEKKKTKKKEEYRSRERSCQWKLGF